MIKSKQISPSVLSADFSKLDKEINSLNGSGCSILHLDIMDGQYVPNITFGPFIASAIRRLTNMELEAHLMIADPDKYIEDFVKAGADIILLHPTTCKSVRASLKRVHDLGAKAGLVVNPDESLEIVQPFFSQIDQLLIMSVYPGFGGQKFIPDVLENLPAFLPEILAHDIILEIDGGVSLDTLPTMQNSGITRFVAGSAVFNHSASPAENYSQLSQLLS